jgi:hypothetical protein
MVNKPKRAGTAAESAVAAFLVENGWPYAERRSLQGALDKGDITGTPGVCWEVKSTSGDHGTINYSGYLREVEVEKANAKASIGVVVVKPRGRGRRTVEQWVAVTYFREIAGFTDLPPVHHAPRKGDILLILRAELGSRVLFCPPGKKKEAGEWHSFMFLADMVKLLRLNGFGSTVSTSSPSTGTSNVDSALT